jgi:N-acetylmuramoyl-L-alanine amidase
MLRTTIRDDSKTGIIGALPRTATFLAALLVLVGGATTWFPGHPPAAVLQAQGTPPPAPLMLITREARRPVPTTMVSGQELIGLDDVATLFQVVVREDTLAGGVTVSYRGRTVVASADQPMASVNGRVVTLPSPVVRSGRRFLVPVEFLSRALAPIYDQKIELRRPQRLLLVGDVRVPRVTARLDNPGPPTRVTIDVTPQSSVAAVAEAGRVLVRIEADALDLALAAGSGGLVEQVRAGDQPNTVLVLVSNAAGMPRVTQSASDGATHVTIDVPSATPAPTPPPDSTAGPRTPPAPDPSLTAPRTGFQTVVIDPGHGGDDHGARGPGGIEEKAITLDIARRLRGLLEARMGVRVVLTRDDDRAVPLDARAAVANSSKANLFLSLHVNATLVPSVAGAEVYHLKLDREGEDARRQAEADAVTLPVLSGGTRRLDVIRWDLAQARHVDESARLATLVTEELGKLVKLSPRGVQQAPLRVLEGADTPAALIEMLYVSNPDQEKAAGTEEFKAALSLALYNAVARFRGFSEDQGGR